MYIASANLEQIVQIRIFYESIKIYNKSIFNSKQHD